jgi:hypothetical protein
MKNVVMIFFCLLIGTASFANTSEVERADLVEKTEFVEIESNNLTTTLFFGCGQFYVCGNLVAVCDTEDLQFMIDEYC